MIKNKKHFVGTERHLSISSKTRWQSALKSKMASVCKAIRGCLFKKRPNSFRYLSNNASGKRFASSQLYPIFYAIGGAVTLYTAYKHQQSFCVHIVEAKSVSYWINNYLPNFLFTNKIASFLRLFIHLIKFLFYGFISMICQCYI